MDTDHEIDVMSGEDGGATCAYKDGCNLLSPGRRVVSHYFGRNKKETLAMPEYVWVNYCRQHYQRCRYRNSAEEFAETQMYLVRKTVENLKKWGAVTGFDLDLRKRAVDNISTENEYIRNVKEARSKGLPEPQPLTTARCRERVLLPYVGKNKSFADIYEFIEMVTQICLAEKCEAFEFEIIPVYKPGHLKKQQAIRRAEKRASKQKAATTPKASTPAQATNQTTPSPSLPILHRSFDLLAAKEQYGNQYCVDHSYSGRLPGIRSDPS